MTERRSIPQALLLLLLIFTANLANSQPGFEDSLTHNYLVSEIPFSFTDISATGTGHFSHIGDDQSITLPIGFAYEYFGTTYTMVTVSGNGQLFFGATSDTFWTNGANTNGAHPEENGGSIHQNYSQSMIAFAWEDWDVTDPLSDNIYTETVGGAGLRHFIVQYNSVARFSGTTTDTIQVMLSEENEDIIINFANFDSTHTNGMAIGIQGNSANYLQYIFDPKPDPGNQLPNSNTSLRFALTSPIPIISSPDVDNLQLTSDQATSIIINWNQPVTGFTASDFQTTNGLISGFVQSALRQYTFTLTAITSGSVELFIPANVANALGLPNEQSNLFQYTFEPFSIDRDIVLHLPFNGNPLDIGPFSNHGTLAGTPIFNTGQIGGAIQGFGGSPGDHIFTSQTAELDFGSSFSYSVSFWIRAGSWDKQLPIVGNKDISNDNNPGWSFFANANGRKLHFNPGRTSFTVLSLQTPAIDDNQWHHVVGTVGRQGFARVFLDGVERGKTASNNLLSLSNSLNLGILQDSTLNFADGAFPGAIDDLIIWRRQLTPKEITTIYDDGTVGDSIVNIPDVTLDSLTVVTSGTASTTSTNFLATFTRPVIGFTATDLLTTNATITSFTALSTTQFSFVVNAISTGVVELIVPAAVAFEAVEGTSNSASLIFDFLYDDEAVTVYLTSAQVAAGGTTAVSPVIFTAVFSREISGFTAGDIIASNAFTPIANLTQATTTTWAFDLFPVFPGDVSLQIPFGRATGVAAPMNANIASPPFVFSYSGPSNLEITRSKNWMLYDKQD